MTRLNGMFVGMALALSLVACGAEGGVDDELAGDDGAQITDGKADLSNSALAEQSTYYSVRRDVRKCVSPLCGGWFVAAVNKDSITCADGKKHAECYVAELDFSAEGDVALDSGDLVRGTLSKKTYGNFGKLGTFTATEVWTAGTDSEPSGVFVRVKDNGLRCIAAPCPTLTEHKLNSALSAVISEIDFSFSGATDEQASDASLAEFSADGLIIAGYRDYVYGPAGKGKSRTVTAFWTRAKPALPECRQTGCAASICADHEVITTCIWRPEFVCFQAAECTRQADGECGFTQTAELAACLANPNP